MEKVKNIQRRSACPISFGLDIFGDKWTLLILRDILFYNRTRFSDFAPHERIATNVLADRLAKLEKTGLITKQRDDRLKNQFIYSTTETGKSLLPALIELTLWGFENDSQAPVSELFLERIRAERPKVIREITRAVRRHSFLKYRQAKMGISVP